MHLSADDLTRLTLAAEPDPMWEIVLSLRALIRSPNRGVSPGHDWQGRALGRARKATYLLLPLVTPSGEFPRFLVPAEQVRDVESGIAAVVTTPRAEIGQAIEEYARGRPLPDWVPELYAGRPQRARGLDRLAKALRLYHRAVISPELPRIRALVHADRALHARAFLDGGVDGMLLGFRPHLRWRRPILDIDEPGERELRAGGLGVELVPSYFARRPATRPGHASRPPVVVYPLARTGSPATLNGSLSTLLGRTRASLLGALHMPATTTELAGRVGVSTATASQHATVLRTAGLISTQRQGSSVLHTLTALGRQLLAATPLLPYNEVE
jgi:DNA-binding transcriptional ArsR family regulator